MKEGFVQINGVPTHIFTWGPWIEDKLEESVQEIILVITGNPGLGGFYTAFCSTIYDELDQKSPIWLIGHAGHDEPKPEPEMIMPSLENNHDAFNLKGQIQHKVEFIRNFVPDNVKIHLVGHSIGSKISMELLKFEDISDKVRHCYLLFPTIERMVESRNGILFFKFFDQFYFFIRLIYYAFSFVPLIIRTFILYAFCLLLGYPKFFLGTMLKLSSPKVLDKIWFLTRDEMKLVRDIDAEIIEKNLKRLKFYYGTTDGWVPVNYFNQLVKQFPGIDAELCEIKIDHAFVISNGSRMARMISDWIKRRLIKLN